jgi:hypothetical protein
LLRGHRAYEHPDTRSTVRTIVSASRPITGEQTTLPVIGQRTGTHGVRWLRVMLPGRPNGSAGWIAQAGTRTIFSSWRLTVNIGSRRVRAYLRGRLVRTFLAVVGKPSTPTPNGNFFVEETEAMPASEAGAPFALALSARSNVLQEFAGGPGQIAIHGRDNLAGAPGTAASHGCVRLSTPDVSWLAARIRPGVRVSITA